MEDRDPYYIEKEEKAAALIGWSMVLFVSLALWCGIIKMAIWLYHLIGG